VPKLPVFVITGTSGAGKGTLVKGLLERVPEVQLAVSATTREQRPGEQDGREYWFLSHAEFASRLDGGHFLEHIDFPWGQRSGTLWSELDRISAAGRAPLLELETNGALVVRDEVPGSVTIFVKAPTFDELARRLRERATESAGEIGERLELARQQLAQEHEFRHVVVNDDLERATGELVDIVRNELQTAAVAHASRLGTQPDPAEAGGVTGKARDPS
jgi:guanylate kinase